MEIIQKVSDITNLKYNQVISSGEIELVNTKINFNGTNNLIFIHNPSNVKVQIVNTDVTFYGNNNLLFIDAGKFKYTFSLHMYHNSVCHIGANNYFNPYGEILRLRCAEEKNIFIGDDGMYSTSVEAWVSDSHLIFDCNNLQRINYAKSIYIGDHVWLGKLTNVLKGSKIGSGAIVGTHSVVTKKIPSNTSWGGVPARQIGKDVFFVGYNAQPYKAEDIKAHSTYQSDRWIFNEDENTICFDQIENALNSLGNPTEKANYLVELDKNKKKNRFYISE